MNKVKITAPDGIAQTTCGLCHMSCGLELKIEDGEITRVSGMLEHPLNKGFTCAKGRNVLESVFSPERLTAPLLKEGSGFKEITWEQAMETLTGKLKEILEKGNPQSLAAAIGTPVMLSGSSTVGLIRRFARVFGASSCFAIEAVCPRCRMFGYISTLGRFSVADPENSSCIMIWGSNPDHSSPPYGLRIWGARKRGAKLIVIDPRSTSLTERADLHLQPRYGTGSALILSMINVILKENLYDQEFVSRYTVGFEKLAEHIKAYPPAHMEKITSVPAEKIREAARMFASAKPACVVQGSRTLDRRSSNGFQNSRVAAILQALTGNVGIAGGIIQAPRLKVNTLEVIREAEQKPLGADQALSYCGINGREFSEGERADLEAILTGGQTPVEIMILCNANPLVVFPDPDKTARALNSLKFLVVMDERMTETAKLADLILPVGTFLERDELSDFYTLWGVPFIMMRKKIVEHGQSRSLMDIWLELAHSLGFETQFPWNSSEEVIDYVLEPSGLTARDLLENKPDGFIFGTQEYKQYEKEGFKTPSGKIELYSELLAGLGIPPLPALHKKEEIEPELETENVHFHLMGEPIRDIMEENPWEYYINNWLSK